jgi:hypothetical protein
MGRTGKFWALLAVTLAVYGVLVAVVGPPMQALANGGAIPDLRITGYDAADIRALLDGAEPGFAEAYARVSLSWDRAVPVLFALTFGYGIWIGGLPRVFVLVPILMGLADLAENTLAARMLLAGPAALDPAHVAWASAFTVAKWVLFPVTLLLLVTGLVRRRKADKEVRT